MVIPHFSVWPVQEGSGPGQDGDRAPNQIKKYSYVVRVICHTQQKLLKAKIRYC